MTTTTTRQEQFNAIAQLITEGFAAAARKPERPARPKVATLEQLEAYEEARRPYEEAKAVETETFAQARELAAAANLPEGIWVRAEIDGVAYGITMGSAPIATYGGMKVEHRFAIEPWGALTA